jgi:hypothetical protein
MYQTPPDNHHKLKRQTACGYDGLSSDFFRKKLKVSVNRFAGSQSCFQQTKKSGFYLFHLSFRVPA